MRWGDRSLFRPACYLIGEGIEVCAHRITAAELGGLEAPDDVLEGGSHHEVLLLQPKLLPFEELREVQGRVQLGVAGCGAQSCCGCDQESPYHTTSQCPKLPPPSEPRTFCPTN